MLSSCLDRRFPVELAGLSSLRRDGGGAGQHGYGQAVPQIADLLEVKTMLAEHAMDWTQEWKDFGREQERREALQALRQIAWRRASAL
jgi:hypothetical protein